ncbi:MAG: UDP-N-acetylmuramoyl-L-alanine--D-glutamate ligase [Actinomycetota bacterium]
MTGVFAGESAVVIGFGVSGRAAAGVLAAEGAKVRVSEARTLDDLEASPAGSAKSAEHVDEPIEDVEVLAGGHSPEHLNGASLVVVSPGVPQGADVLAWARQRGLPIWSELELGARLCRVPYVAVTGTNGKTTTVELLATMMRAGGLSAKACGNVGYPFSQAARDGSLQALAVECSSFQLAFQESLHPKVSVLLNLAPDHLDWHGSFEAYVLAKARVFARQGPGDTHVGNRDDPEAARLSQQAPCTVRWFGRGAPGPGEVGLDGGRVLFEPGEVGEKGTASVIDLGRPAPEHPSFLADAAAAAAAGLAFGLLPEAIGAALGSFTPLPHRGTVVAQAGSVRFVDDSKATNPHAALAALQGLKDAVLIAGGLAKGVDLSPLGTASANLAAVVAIGEAAPAVAAVFDGLVPVIRASSIEKAVELAFGTAPPGGIVILAPACASQDMFRDYRERGERFASAARALSARVGESNGGPARKSGRHRAGRTHG